jgi:cyclase
MPSARIIPCLLLRGNGLVKTTRFADPKYVGDPINAVRIFNDKEVDELLLLDILASKEARGPNMALVEQIVSEAFMPVGFGGGVRSVEQARSLLRIGIEKIAVNTAALEGLGIVRDLADKFGAQCVVGVVDVKKRWLGGYTVHSHTGVRLPERDPVAWAQRLAEAGAGEILVQSVDRDGTMSGYDLDLLRTFSGSLRVPLIAAGGAANVDDMVAALQACTLSGLAIGARFVYQGPHRAVLINYLDARDMDRIRRAGPEADRGERQQ